MQTYVCPLTEVNLTVEGSVVKRLRFIQKPTCKRCLKFAEYLVQAHSLFVEIMLMQTLCLPNEMFASLERKEKLFSIIFNGKKN